MKPDDLFFRGCIVLKCRVLLLRVQVRPIYLSLQFQVQAASILFVDNPVGTGYSYVTRDSAYTTDVSQIAADLVTLFSAFLEKWPVFEVSLSCSVSSLVPILRLGTRLWCIMQLIVRVPKCIATRNAINMYVYVKKISM